MALLLVTGGRCVCLMAVGVFLASSSSLCLSILIPQNDLDDRFDDPGENFKVDSLDLLVWTRLIDWESELQLLSGSVDC